MPRGALFRSTWWAEFWSGTMAIGWAIAFVVSGQSLSFSTPNTFLALERIAPGELWAWFCLIMGAAQLVALLLDWRTPRWVCAIIMSWFPCTAVISMLVSDHLVPHIAVYGGWAGINILSILRPFRLVH